MNASHTPRSVALVFAALLAAALTAHAAEAPARPVAPAADHNQAIGELIAKLADKSPDVQERAKRAYQAAVLHAARPGAEKERLAASKAICERLGADVPKPAVLALLDALEHIGRDEAVPRLTKLLGHADPLVRERARRALVANPSPKASAPLGDALAEARTPAWKIALINALGHRKDKAAVPALMRLARSDDEPVRVNAVEALARIGDKAAAGVISEATQKATNTRVWRRTLVAYLALADALAAADEKAAALEMYRNLLDAPGHLKVGAIVGLGRAGGADELPALLGYLGGPAGRTYATQTRLRPERSAPASQREFAARSAAAKAAINLLPVEAVTKALTEKMKGAAPEMKAVLLNVLASRGEKESLPAFLAAAGDADPSVRAAAYGGMGKLADDRAMPVLLAALGKAAGDELGAVRAAIGRIHSPSATQALIGAVAKGAPKVRTEIIALLADRRAAAAVPALLKAAEDRDAAVRRAAFKALGVLADAKTLPKLVGLLVKAPSSGAEKALAAACKRIENAAAALVAALKNAPVPARGALLRVLGRIESPTALAAIQAARQDANPEVQDAAIRALASWPTPAVLGDLLAIAKSAPKETHRVIALRGYVRVAGLVEGKSAEEIVKLYENAMAAARRPEDKRMVLAGIADVASLGSLQMATRYLDDAALRGEAAAAAVKLAVTLHGIHRAEAKAALEKAAAADPRRAAQIKPLIARIGKLGDYVTAWQVSGPYTGSGLLQAAFPPEKPGDTTATWRIMPPSPYVKNVSWVWSMDLGTFLGGDHRAAYLRTRIWSPRKQPAVIELGTDDTCRLWLGGKLVHTFAKPRSLKSNEDKIRVTLEQGWNLLLLKVVQGGGDWGATLRIRGPKGGQLDGIKADPFGK